MKVLLATAPNIKKRGIVEYPPIYPPLGLMYISSQIKNKLPQVEVCLIDGLKIGFETFWNKLKKENPDIIGLSFNTLNSVDAFHISEKIKAEFPDSLLIAGGTHTSFLPVNTLQKGAFDIGIIGEGELTMIDIITNFHNNKFKKIDGIVFRKGNQILLTKQRQFIKNLDSIPFPDRDEIKITTYPGFYYSKSKPDTSFLSTRGCPYECVFCANPWRTGKPRVRLRSPTNIVEELKELKYKYKIKEVFDWADEFNINSKWAIDVCKQIINEKLDIPLKAQFRANITKELAKNLSQSGFWLALVGIESANQKTLNGICKNIRINEIIKTCKNLKKHGIKVFGYFMGFNVWEDNKKLFFEGLHETENTIKFIRKLLHLKLIDYFSFSFATPYPGSKLYEIANKFNLISDINIENYTSHEPILSLPGISKREMLNLKKDAVTLQAKTALTGNELNINLFKFYTKKFIEILKLNF